MPPAHLSVYNYPRPALTVDCIIFGVEFVGQQAQLNLLLIQRKLPPFVDQWGLPGGFVRVGETLEQAARRELAEETGLEGVFLEQLYSFSGLERDPREQVVTVAYYALVNLSDHHVQAATDAKQSAWFRISECPTLAFDHADIVAMGLQRLRGKLRYQPIGFALLPPKFTLSQLQQLYEAILEQPLDKRNFRKKILKMGLLEELAERQQDVAHRAAQLYRFDAKRYTALQQAGFNFEL